MGGLGRGFGLIADQLIADLLLLFGPILGVAAGEEKKPSSGFRRMS
jgi:hypothetical protein